MEFLEKNPIIKNAFNLLNIILLLSAIFLVISIYQLFSEPREVSDAQIRVSGDAEVAAVPDTATFSFSVERQSNEVSVAQTEVESVVQSAVEILEDAGIEEKDIKTTEYNVYPRYRQDDPRIMMRGEREIIGYTVNQSISVKVREMELAGEVVANLGGVGITRISGLQFIIEDESALKQEARELAIEKAKEEAKVLAEQLSVRLVRVVDFQESMHFPYAMRSGVEMVEDGVAMDRITIPEGENLITSQVHITYEIR